MDYSGKIFGDWLGLGKYDEAAIIFAYSGGSEPGYVEVFDNARTLSQVFPGSDGANVTALGNGTGETVRDADLATGAVGDATAHGVIVEARSSEDFFQLAIAGAGGFVGVSATVAAADLIRVLNADIADVTDPL